MDLETSKTSIITTHWAIRRRVNIKLSNKTWCNSATKHKYIHTTNTYALTSTSIQHLLRYSNCKGD